MGFAALEFVTPIASSNQIFSRIATAGRARNYMVNNERHPDESARCLTIFATVMGFGGDMSGSTREILDKVTPPAIHLTLVPVDHANVRPTTHTPCEASSGQPLDVTPSIPVVR